MTMEFTIPWAPIKALSHLAAESDIRRWLQGVWIDSSGPRRVIVASDGRALGAYRTEEPSTNVPPLFIPLRVIKLLKALTGLSVTIRQRGDDLEIAGLGDRCSFSRGDEKMVDWRRVFPKAPPSGISQQFDPELVARFAKVRKGLARKGAEEKGPVVRIAHDGGRPGYAPALVTLAGVDAFAGALMSAPWDAKGTPWTTTTPDWVTQLDTAPAPAPADDCADLV